MITVSSFSLWGYPLMLQAWVNSVLGCVFFPPLNSTPGVSCVCLTSTLSRQRCRQLLHCQQEVLVIGKTWNCLLMGRQPKSCVKVKTACTFLWRIRNVYGYFAWCSGCKWLRYAVGVTYRGHWQLDRLCIHVSAFLWRILFSSERHAVSLTPTPWINSNLKALLN